MKNALFFSVVSLTLFVGITFAATAADSYFVKSCPENNQTVWRDPRNGRLFRVVQASNSNVTVLPTALCQNVTGTWSEGLSYFDFLQVVSSNMSLNSASIVKLPLRYEGTTWIWTSGPRKDTIATEISLDPTPSASSIGWKPLTGEFVRIENSQAQVDILIQYEVCGDGVCDDARGENCAICPLDCHCYKPSLVAHMYDDTIDEIPYRISIVPSIASQLLNEAISFPFGVKWTGMFRSDSNFTEFNLTTSNGRADVKISEDSTTATPEFYLSTWSLHEQQSVSALAVLKPGKVFYFLVEFFSSQSSSQGNGTIALTMRRSSSEPWRALGNYFYSVGVCGDGICDPYDPPNCRECPRCGDGECTGGETFETCFKDCWNSQFSCDEHTRVNRPLNVGTPHNDDTLGDLIANQVMMRVPGIEHLLHGIDGYTGVEGASSVFDFHYCDEKNFIQDTYRESAYQLPVEVAASPFPSCTYSADTTIYSNSYEYSKELDQGGGFSLTAHGSLKVKVVDFEGGPHIQGELSVKKASEFQAQNSGKIAVTNSTCYAYKAEMLDYHLSSHFLKDLNEMQGYSDCLAVVKKYGTHYYKHAKLGGTLKEVRSVSKKHIFSKSTNELEGNIEASYSGKVSVALVASANYKISGNYHRQSTDESQTETENESIHSSIITYGGLPGSFGPGENGFSDTPSTWSEWASTVDVLPVPVDYKVGFLLDHIPDTVNRYDVSIADCWAEAYVDYMKEGDTPSDYPTTEYEIHIEMQNANSSLVAGPFAFQFVDSNGDVTDPFPILNATTQKPLLFRARNTYTIKVTTKTLARISAIKVSDLRVYFPLYGIGDTADGWLVKSIHVSDWQHGKAFLFDNITLAYEVCNPSCSYSAPASMPRNSNCTGDPAICTIQNSNPMNAFHVQIEYNNPQTFGADLDFFLTLQGENGHISGLYSTKRCTQVSRFCDVVPNGKVSYWMHGQILSDLLTIEISPIDINPSATPLSEGVKCTSPPIYGYKHTAHCEYSYNWMYDVPVTLDRDAYVGEDLLIAPGWSSSNGAAFLMPIKNGQLANRGIQTLYETPTLPPIKFLLQEPLTSNKTTRMYYTRSAKRDVINLPGPPAVSVTIVPSYNGPICQETRVFQTWDSWGPTSEYSLFANFTATPLALCQQQATFISSITVTSFNHLGDSKMYHFNGPILLTKNSDQDFGLMANACAPFFSQNAGFSEDTEFLKAFCNSTSYSAPCEAKMNSTLARSSSKGPHYTFFETLYNTTADPPNNFDGVYFTNFANLSQEKGRIMETACRNIHRTSYKLPLIPV